MWIVILDDGETYSLVQGSKVLYVPNSVDLGENENWVKENAHRGVDLAITDSESSLLSGDIFISNLESIESEE